MASSIHVQNLELALFVVGHGGVAYPPAQETTAERWNAQERSQEARIGGRTGGSAEIARAFFASKARLRRKKAARALLRSTSVRVAAAPESSSLT